MKTQTFTFSGNETTMLAAALGARLEHVSDDGFADRMELLSSMAKFLLTADRSYETWSAVCTSDDIAFFVESLSVLAANIPDMSDMLAGFAADLSKRATVLNQKSLH